MEDKTYGTLVTDCGIQLIAAAVMEGKKSILRTLLWATAAEATTSRILP